MMRTRTTNLWVWLALAGWSLAGGVTAVRAAEGLEFRPRQVLRGPVRAITNAPVVPAAQATPRVVRDNELVLGVVVHGAARAYPLNQLTGPSREIINDRLGGRPIAATW